MNNDLFEMHYVRTEYSANSSMHCTIALYTDHTQKHEVYAVTFDSVTKELVNENVFKNAIISISAKQDVDSIIFLDNIRKYYNAEFVINSCTILAFEIYRDKQDLSDFDHAVYLSCVHAQDFSISEFNSK